jgi:hypothetical protein
LTGDRSVVGIIGRWMSLNGAWHLLDSVPCNPPRGLDDPRNRAILSQGLTLGLRQHGGIEVERDFPLLRHDRLLTLTLQIG